jgi:acetolactate decarboxylase
VAAFANRQGYDPKELLAFGIGGKFDQTNAHIVTPRSPEIEAYKPEVKSQKFFCGKR